LSAASTERRATEIVMGMPITVISAAGHDEVFTWLRWVDEVFSPFRADSQISRIDRGELRAADAHPHVRAVLARCERLRVASSGYFDARAGGRLDPSGLVKGWAIDRAASLLRGRFLIDAGGDVLVRGGPWRVGIRHPLRADALCAALELTDGAVATSGAYERGAHILDPTLGRADAYATAAFAMGRRGPAWTARLRGCEAMTVLGDGEVRTTRGWERYRRPLSRRG
jgi:thiamine biosynthesis lipoprotein